ncbi:hypothetical protein [Streptomyces erythrochromogenes]|uniref:hypothetical protein n=1 Tax=Streptomyces erythrochromogenes TaxID=285574 RepID=UPI0037CEED3F
MNESTTDEAEPTHLTTRELAERWRTTTNAIYTSRSKGRPIPGGSFRRGTSVLWPLAQVKAYERERNLLDPLCNPELRLANQPVERKRPRHSAAHAEAA